MPRDWQLMPPDPKWQGRRYMSPEGDAWLAFYATNAANDAQARFKAVAFADGEEVTYLRGERDRLTVSGLKDDKIFYRKVTLACGGTIWRHVAMEYPAAAKEKFRSFRRTRMSRGFEQIADDACGDNLFSSPQPANAAGAAERSGRAEAGRAELRHRRYFSAGATAASCWPERLSASATKPLAFISSMKARR